MELLYAFGIACINFLQQNCPDIQKFTGIINLVFNPHYLMDYVFPLLSTWDSVFGAQMLFAIAFGGWSNTMLKWILVEDRPFWWVRETNYYRYTDRPIFRQNRDTCETGPGSPSGHCAAAATMFILAEMWCCHVIRDLGSARLKALHDKLPLRALYFIIMTSVGLARTYVGAHFPHQCLMGGLLGSFISPGVCLFVTDPYLLRNSPTALETRRNMNRNIVLACTTMGLSILLGFVYSVLDVDLHWATRMAFRWCSSADFIFVKSSPVFAIVQSTGILLGWAITVTPEVTKYRHFTRHRNECASFLATVLAMFIFKRLEDSIPNRKIPFYIAHFVLNVIKPFVYLRLIPRMALKTYVRPPPRPRVRPKTPVAQPGAAAPAAPATPATPAAPAAPTGGVVQV